ncbi:hypothetical protein K2X92_01895 [Candidatus Gracilibacteria bacterium]|nr:hypothetical protein [Candidatus Gracilibacteria bacterium]
MALVIKIISRANSKPISGMSVKLTRPGIISREIPTKKTSSEGKVFFELQACNAILSINGVVQEERYLGNEENVFYI